MDNEYKTVKLSEEARRRLRLIAASTGETMIEVMDRLTAEELKQLEKEKERGKNVKSDG